MNGLHDHGPARPVLGHPALPHRGPAVPALAGRRAPRRQARGAPPPGVIELSAARVSRLRQAAYPGALGRASTGTAATAGQPSGRGQVRGTPQVLSRVASCPGARDRSRATSRSLAEIRTVLSWAGTARQGLDQPRKYHRLPKTLGPASRAGAGEAPAQTSRPAGRDPESYGRRATLDEVISLVNRRTLWWAEPVPDLGERRTAVRP